MENFEVECTIVGAGIVGLAAARALARIGLAPLILERNAAFGEETSSRNSEVIHAGLYYPPGSFKAMHCVEGRDRLYAYCAARGIRHRRCGKLIVASDARECEALEGIAQRAAASGVNDLRWLDAGQAREIEPALSTVGALASPSTGIIDSHALMLSLLGEAEDVGATLATHTELESGRLLSDGRIEFAIRGEPTRFRTRHLVIAAGLRAQAVARRIEGLPPPPEEALVKGNYFALSGRAPFSRLIYPAPRDGGLGVHLTLDLAGRAKFGPDTEWLQTQDPDAIDYRVDPSRADAFYAAIRRYWPGIPDGALLPDYAGVRPKLAGETYPDFRIDGVAVHGLPGHVFLYGIESPGLTSALSIAEAVAAEIAAAR